MLAFLSFDLLRSVTQGCPCGYLYDPKKSCVCTQREIEKYKKRVSGPILDRIDLHVDVPVVDIEALSTDVGARHSENVEKMENGKSKIDKSEDIRKRVEIARQIQSERLKEEMVHTNAEMKNKHIKKHCKLSSEVNQLLTQAARTFNLSARSYFKMIKVSRTIADLDQAKDISVTHMAEALQYRPKMGDGE